MRIRYKTRHGYWNWNNYNVSHYYSAFSINKIVMACIDFYTPKICEDNVLVLFWLLNSNVGLGWSNLMDGRTKFIQSWRVLNNMHDFGESKYFVNTSLTIGCIIILWILSSSETKTFLTTDNQLHYKMNISLIGPLKNV